MIAPRAALARIPDELAAADAEPLLCAGIATFNGLREGGAPAAAQLDAGQPDVGAGQEVE
jgi:D-arabinose 1-dehydrogenase-like Zn-dependent alcohol dehydrogenase